MKPTKQIVYLPVKIGNDTNTGLIVKYIRSGHKYPIEEQQAFVFTPEQLNEYTQSVIKQALETAAEEVETKQEVAHFMEGSYMEVIVSKEDCKILFNEAVNWYNSWKKCERGKHSPNPAYKDKCFSCLNRYNFNWKDLGSGENKVMKMYNFNKREINKKQRRELTRMESIESLNTALLYMNYDMNKTLTENKNIILKK